MHIWSHPIDVHYSAADLSGWPKANFRIWRLNNANKLDTCTFIQNIFIAFKFHMAQSHSLGQVVSTKSSATHGHHLDIGFFKVFTFSLETNQG